MVYGWLDNALSGVFPDRCLLCGAPGAGGRNLCRPCRHSLPWNRNPCRRCALPLPAGPGGELCGRCLRRPPAWDRVRAPLLYAWPVDRLIQRFKFNGDLAAGRLLAGLLAEALAAEPEPLPAGLLAVPLHPARLRERGYNQAMELAAPVSRRLGLCLLRGACRRMRATQVQSRLNARERRRNLRGAFAVPRPLPVRHLAAVDDVLTTGATAEALSCALRQAGAERVEFWCVARATGA